MRLHHKTVLVTGVSGTLGDKIAAKCVSEGAVVKGLIRDEQQAALCRKLRITPIVSDLTDCNAIKGALSDVNIVIHAAAYLGEDKVLAEHSNIHGVQNLVDQAILAGVERFTHISTTSVYGHYDGEVEFHENSELAYDHPEVYISTKCESEKIVRNAMSKGLPSVILRPGIICAEHNSHWGDRLIRSLADAKQVDWIHPADLLPWVHADNVAEMCMLSATLSNAVNETYNAVDGNYTEEQFTMRFVNALGKQPIVPNGNPIRISYRCSKIRNELGYEPIKSFEETVVQLELQAQQYGIVHPK